MRTYLIQAKYLKHTRPGNPGLADACLVNAPKYKQLGSPGSASAPACAPSPLSRDPLDTTASRTALEPMTAPRLGARQPRQAELEGEKVLETWG